MQLHSSRLLSYSDPLLLLLFWQSCTNYITFKCLVQLCWKCSLKCSHFSLLQGITGRCQCSTLGFHENNWTAGSTTGIDLQWQCSRDGGQWSITALQHVPEPLRKSRPEIRQTKETTVLDLESTTMDNLLRNIILFLFSSVQNLFFCILLQEQRLVVLAICFHFNMTQGLYIYKEDKNRIIAGKKKERSAC